jgi:hypothetical protein
MMLVLGSYLGGEVLDHLTVAQKEQRALERQESRDLGEEKAQVLIASALAGRVFLGGCRAGRTMSRRDGGVEVMNHTFLRAPEEYRGRTRRDPHAGEGEVDHPGPSEISSFA